MQKQILIQYLVDHLISINQSTIYQACFKFNCLNFYCLCFSI